ENLTDVGHRTPPSRHSSPPGVGVLQSGFRVTVRTRKESGHAATGGSVWPTLGGSAWVTLPGSVWATPGGSASPTPVAQYGVAADNTALYGPGVIPGSTSASRYDHYNLLRTIEDGLGLGTLEPIATRRPDSGRNSISSQWGSASSPLSRLPAP